MAKTTKYGATNSKNDVSIADYQHASHTFVDNFFRLAPKHKFLYHVSFQINSAVAGGFVEKHGNEISLLVKYADLPKFDIDTEVKQQYNRKKVIQTRLDYSPVMIRFHDDNEGVITRLWQAYYDYYYADTQSPYLVNNVYGPMDGSMRYGLDNGSTSPFFYNISISALARHTFHTAKLTLPKITSWQHDSFDAAAGSEVMESTMQIQYEKVEYSTGNIQEGENPAGFATGEHYDTEKSYIGLNSGSSSETGSTVNNLPAKFDTVLFTKHEPTYNIVNDEQIDQYQNTKDKTLEGYRANGLALSFSEEDNKERIGTNGIFFSNKTDKNNFIKATQKSDNNKKYDANKIIEQMDNDNTLKYSIVEQYYYLETKNSNFRQLNKSLKDFYVNEFYSNIQNSNPKSINLASKILNT